MIRIVGGAATDPGRVRSSNQDRIAVRDGVLYAVADGMGGHRGGEVAATIVADGLFALADANAARDAEGFPDLKSTTVADCIVGLNQRVIEQADENDDLYGMGTTLTAVALTTAQSRNGASEVVVSVFNIGDSRTYLLRNGELQQLTEDHSLVADLIRAGEITEAEARTHRQRSVVTRALGVEHTIELDVLDVLPSPGMRFLLCSDGLSGEVGDEQIGSILRRLADPREAARELVRMANERGGRDNVSVVVVDVFDDTGKDSQALKASASVEQTVRPRTTTSPQGSSNAASVKGPTADQKSSKPKKVRQPFPVNLRVIVFLALLAALGSIVLFVVKNAPKTDEVPVVDNSTVPLTVDSTLDVSTTAPTSTPTIPIVSSSVVGETPATGNATSTVPIGGFSEANGDTLPTTTSIPKVGGAASGEVVVTTTPVDDFAPETTTKAPKKTKRNKTTKKSRQ